MSGRDDIDDASAVVASLRAEVAAQRALLEDVRNADDAYRAAFSPETFGFEPHREAIEKRQAAIDAIRAHLAGAAVPAASAHELPQAVRVAGAKMANLCFNLAQQRRFDEHDRAMIKRLQEDWDAAIETKP